MPENLKALRNRIQGIKSTKKITRAMEMVSAAKLRRTETTLRSSRPFIKKLESLIGRLAHSEGAQDHPLFQVSETGYPLLVVFTSDRGLCGAFNASLLKKAAARLDADPELRVFVIGGKGRDFMRRNYRDRIAAERIDLNTQLDGEISDGIAKELLNGFRDGHYSQVDLLYTHFISKASQKPVEERYLPMNAEAFAVEQEEEDPHYIDYIMEPSPARVFDAILPQYLMSKIFLVLAESFTAEHSARMLAMNNATKNCDELTEKFTLRMNKARQAAITTEIIEIVSGASAAQQG